MFDAWSSEPPASGSSRSRHARIAHPAQPGFGGDVAELGHLDVASVLRVDGRVMRDACYGRRPFRGSGNRTPTGNLPAMARLTGERPMEGATPDSLLAFHDAGYREMRERLGSGHRPRRRLRRGRRDRRASRGWAGWSSASTTTPTPRSTPPASAAPEGLRFAAMDGARSASRTGRSTGSAPRTSSSTSRPPSSTSPSWRAWRRDDGTAFVITPNRPADFENPFHVSLFEAPELESLLALFFDDVDVHGLEGRRSCTPTSRNGAPAARSCSSSTRSSCDRRCPGAGTCGATSTCPAGRVPGARLVDAPASARDSTSRTSS